MQLDLKSRISRGAKDIVWTLSRIKPEFCTAVPSPKKPADAELPYQAVLTKAGRDDRVTTRYIITYTSASIWHVHMRDHRILREEGNPPNGYEFYGTQAAQTWPYQAPP